MSLRNYHDLTLTANDATAYTPFWRPHRRLWQRLWQRFYLKFYKRNYKIMCLQKKEKINIMIHVTLRALFAWGSLFIFWSISAKSIKNVSVSEYWNVPNKHFENNYKPPFSLGPAHVSIFKLVCEVTKKNTLLWIIYHIILVRYLLVWL